MMIPDGLCSVERLPQTIDLAPDKEATVHYIVTPHRRGASEMIAVHLRYPTRLGLWFRQQSATARDPDSHLSRHSRRLSI